MLDADVPEIRIELRVGHLAVGYEDVVIAYVDAEMEVASEAALRNALDDPNTEILYDEVDLGVRRRFCHRLLFWPYREVELTFDNVVITRSPAAAREFEDDVEQRWLEL